MCDDLAKQTNQSFQDIMLPKVKNDTDSKLSKNSQDLLKDLRKLLGRIQQQAIQDAAELEAGEIRTSTHWIKKTPCTKNRRTA